jgi:hypothetical protein
MSTTPSPMAVPSPSLAAAPSNGGGFSLPRIGCARGLLPCPSLVHISCPMSPFSVRINCGGRRQRYHWHVGPPFSVNDIYGSHLTGVKSSRLLKPSHSSNQIENWRVPLNGVKSSRLLKPSHSLNQIENWSGSILRSKCRSKSFWKLEWSHFTLAALEPDAT